MFNHRRNTRGFRDVLSFILLICINYTYTYATLLSVSQIKDHGLRYMGYDEGVDDFDLTGGSLLELHRNHVVTAAGTAVYTSTQKATSSRNRKFTVHHPVRITHHARSPCRSTIIPSLTLSCVCLGWYGRS